ncbi:MAG: hypothetical protein H0W99_13625 [Acidobacteria bacterium]|nr:hypothetical protein [Acidobacteriota bacterium]
MGNYIGINEPPQEMFGKIMSITDDLMRRYYELCTDMTPGEITTLFGVDDLLDNPVDLSNPAPEGKEHPRLLKVRLARRIVKDFYSEMEAETAEEEFNRIHQRKEAPEHIEERTVTSGSWKLPRLLVEVLLAPSMAEARRLIEQGGVYVDSERATRADYELELSEGRIVLIKVGKRRFLRVRGI